ncbi:MAG: menaquinone biosynthesis decarboxylase, partial [Planctomycetes bacterium]|nr:menaquinone biosynthesis decarboxylase [Planctomycetota bacterium]
MAYRSLREFVERLDREGQLRKVSAEVSAELEITEIADRVSKAGGPALLFERVKGSQFPLLINAFGSFERMAMALGVRDVNDIAADIERLIKPQIPEGLVDKLKMIPLLARLLKFPPKTVASGPCQD